MIIELIQDIKYLKLIQIITKEAYGYLPWSEQNYFDDWNLDYTCYYGLWIGSELVGFVHYSYFVDDYEILNVAILSDYQNKGYGQYIITQTLKKVQAQTCLLEVRASNISAQKVYQKVGFQVIQCRKNYYSNPVEDAIIMKWSDDDESVEK